MRGGGVGFLLDTVSLQETIIKNSGKPLSDMLTLFDSLTAQKSSIAQNYSKNLSDTLNLFDALLLHYAGQVSFPETVTFTDALNHLGVFGRTVTDIANLLGSLSTSYIHSNQTFGRELADIQTLIASVSSQFATATSTCTSGCGNNYYTTSTTVSRSTSSVTSTTISKPASLVTVVTENLGMWSPLLIGVVTVVGLWYYDLTPELSDRKRWLLALSPLFVYVAAVTYIAATLPQSTIAPTLTDKLTSLGTTAGTWALLLSPIIIPSLYVMFMNGANPLKFGRRVIQPITNTAQNLTEIVKERLNGTLENE